MTNKIMISIKLFFLFFFFFPIFVFANEIGVFFQDITISVNYQNCSSEELKDVTVQLFADDELVEGKKITLNKINDYTGKFEDVPIFKEGSASEINYQIKILDNGEYKDLPNSSITYKKVHINKWISVLPENLEPNEDYVFITDNWNYKNNGFSVHVALRGDVTVKGAKPEANYTVLDGKKSYYTLMEDPPSNSLWHTSRVPTSNPDYDKFKDYWMLTDEIGKKLTLTGYNRLESENRIHYIFKYSGKEGYVESEDAYYTNKVQIIPIEGTKGRFYISSKSMWPEPHDVTNYLGLDSYNQVVAQTVKEYGAQFLAFKHIEAEVNVISDAKLQTTLCEKKTEPTDSKGKSLEPKNKKSKKRTTKTIKNPNTLDIIDLYIFSLELIIIISIMLIIWSIRSLYLINKNTKARK